MFLLLQDIVISLPKQEGHDGPGLLTRAKTGHENDGISGIRDANKRFFLF